MTSNRARGAASKRPRAKRKPRISAVDGGYYAIKGFLYQFDKTILEMLANGDQAIAFEGVQDIETDDWVVQVKHKERAKFAPSRIAKPVQGLFESFSGDPSRRQVLHCYFRDRSPSVWNPTRAEVESLLGKGIVAAAPRSVITKFVRSFSVHFGEDFDRQFAEVLFGLKRELGYSDIAGAAIAHSLIRSELLRRAAGPAAERRMSLREIRDVIERAEGTVTHRGYAKYLSRKSYIAMVRKQLFSFKRPNIDAFERLFIAEAHPGAEPGDLVRFVRCVAMRYFRKGKSPQPFVCFRGVADEVVMEAKRLAIDSGLRFFDGTYFAGDRFRRDDLVASRMEDDKIVVKWVLLDQARDLARAVRIRETFQFHCLEAADLGPMQGYHAVQVEHLSDAVAMME